MPKSPGPPKLARTFNVDVGTWPLPEIIGKSLVTFITTCSLKFWCLSKFCILKFLSMMSKPPQYLQYRFS